jgi:hypothetical protein
MKTLTLTITLTDEQYAQLQALADQQTAFNRRHAKSGGHTPTAGDTCTPEQWIVGEIPMVIRDAHERMVRLREAER